MKSDELQSIFQNSSIAKQAVLALDFYVLLGMGNAFAKAGSSPT
jgi:hypothetical protein